MLQEAFGHAACGVRHHGKQNFQILIYEYFAHGEYGCGGEDADAPKFGGAPRACALQARPAPLTVAPQTMASTSETPPSRAANPRLLRP